MAELRSPSVLLNNEQIAHLREEVKNVPWKQKLYNNKQTSDTSIKKNADSWINKSITIPARGGHYHLFFCSCGNVLKLPKDNIEDPNGYPCTSCGKIHKGEKYDGGVRWKKHNELANAAQNLALVYIIENDEKYAIKAKEILLKYADSYPGPHTTNLEGGMMYQSLCEAVWSIPLATAYDLIRNTLNAADASNIENKLFKQIGSGLMKVGGAGSGNWGSWHLSAVGVIGFAINDKEMIDYAVNNFKMQISKELGDDGLWPESVHCYHFYPLTAFMHLAQAASNNGIDLFNWEAKPGKGLKSMFTSPISYMYPNQKLPAINDGWFESYLPLNMYEQAYAIYDEPSMAWALKKGYSIQKVKRNSLEALLFGKDLDIEISEPALKSVNFPVLGITILKSPGNSMLTFDYGPFLGHGQLDKMGITLFANDELLSADYGTPGYGSEILNWYISTPAHNTIAADGKSQAKTKERYQTIFYTSELFDIAKAYTEEAYPGIRHERTVIRAGEAFIISDELRSDTSHTYDWFMRSEGDLTVDLEESEEPFESFGYEYIDEEGIYLPSGEWQARWTTKKSLLYCCMMDNEPSALVRAKCFSESASSKVSLLMNRKSGENASFTAIFIPAKKTSDKVERSMSNGEIVIKSGNTKDVISIRKKTSFMPAGYAFKRMIDDEAVCEIPWITEK